MNKIALTLKKERTWKVLICYFVVFLFPIFLGKNFLITGTIVNCFLIFGALNFKKYEVLPLIFLPSIGKLLVGGVFLTMPILPFLLFIWIGNFVLVALYRQLKLKKGKTYIETLILAGMAKIGVLSILPASLSWFTNFGDMSYYPLFALSVGFFQGITILGGGILAAILNKAKVMGE
jgi:hypothetical protein